MSISKTLRLWQTGKRNEINRSKKELDNLLKLDFYNLEGEKVHLEIEKNTLVLENSSGQEVNLNSLLVRVANHIPREAIYFNLNRYVNETCPILVTSQFSNTKDVNANNLKNLIWDSDLTYLTKLFYKYDIRSSSNLSKSILKKRKVYSDSEFINWIANIGEKLSTTNTKNEYAN